MKVTIKEYTGTDFLEQVKSDLNKSMAGQTDSRMASAEDVTTAWLICEIEGLRRKLGVAHVHNDEEWKNVDIELPDITFTVLRPDTDDLPAEDLRTKSDYCTMENPECYHWVGGGDAECVRTDCPSYNNFVNLKEME